MAKAQMSGILRHLRDLRETHAVAEASDAELLGRFADRHEEAAFAGLLRRHGPMVWAVSRRVLPAVHDAEDVFQAAFLLLARKAASIRKRESVGSWLHGVALHLAIKAKTRGASRMAHEKRAADMRDTRPRSEAVRQEVQEALDRALHDLPERYRSALVLCYLEGKSHEEAARLLGCPLTTLRTRVARGRKLLRDRMTSHGLTLSAAGLAVLLMASTAPAAVPSALVKAALKAALPFAAGQAAATLCTARVAGLVEGGLRTMCFSKAKTAVVLLVVGLLVGAGALAHRGSAADEGERPQAAAPQEKPKGAAQAPAGGKHEGDVAVSGRVLGPDGKPFGGARLLVMGWNTKKEDVKLRATTDDDGRFRVTVTAAELSQYVKFVVATAPNHGPDLTWVGKGKATDDVTLRLAPDDVPITGRVLDLEGRPVAGASVGVAWVDEVDLKAWRADPKKGDVEATRNFPRAALDGPTPVKTDKDGRFRLTGVGRDRVAHVQIRGAGIEDNDVEVIARDGKVEGLRLGHRTVYATGSDFIVRPSKPIVGTVRDRKTGKPIAGIRVVCPNMTLSWSGATTDEKGRYRIEGVGKQKEYALAAGGLPYFNSTKLDVPDTQGLDPLEFDFELDRGVVVKGRLTDAATGKAVRGRVGYGPLGDNPNLKNFTEFGKPQLLATDSGRTGDDGAFAVLAIPGGGQLTAVADDADAYAAARQGDIRQYNAVVRIDVPEKDEKPLVRDIVLEPARALAGRIVGPDDKPVSGAYAAGLHAVWQFGRGPEKLEGASIRVHGLVPKEPRVVVFLHPEKQLAKVQKVSAEDKEPLAVRLEATGALAGRALDADGRPRAGLKVKAAYRYQEMEQARVEGKDFQDLPGELLYEYPAWDKIINREATTDKDGKFRIDGLVPGLKYDLTFNDGAQDVIRRENLSVESGKDKDLGDLK
jgi:RNA polymerase sigma factor (sigma-70 family)